MKQVEVGINIDGKTAGCIGMPEFTQDWIYIDSITSYAHKRIEGIEISVWMRVLKKNFLEEGEEVSGTTISEDVKAKTINGQYNFDNPLPKAKKIKKEQK